MATISALFLRAASREFGKMKGQPQIMIMDDGYA